MERPHGPLGRSRRNQGRTKLAEVNRMSLHRRQFLAATALPAAALITGVQNARALEPAGKCRFTPTEFKDKLRGPILSFPTCFTADFQLDFAAMRRLIDRAIEAGVAVVTLTAGNS